MTTLVLIGMVFMITRVMFHGKISLKLVLLLLLVNFVSGFRLELTYRSLIISIRSSFTHLYGFQQIWLLQYFIKITFFVSTNRKNLLLNLKESSDKLVIVAKGFLELQNLHMLIEQEFITPQKLGSYDFWEIANSVLNKDKSATPPLFNDPEVLSSASDKAKLFAKNFSVNSNLDDSGIPLPVSPSRTNLKLHNISLTPKMVKKGTTNLDSSKTSSPD